MFRDHPCCFKTTKTMLSYATTLFLLAAIKKTSKNSSMSQTSTYLKLPSKSSLDLAKLSLEKSQTILINYKELYAYLRRHHYPIGLIIVDNGSNLLVLDSNFFQLSFNHLFTVNFGLFDELQNSLVAQGLLVGLNLLKNLLVNHKGF